MEDFKQRYIAARRAVIAQDLSRLNPMQRQAAMTTEGPLLLLAGAGSGKTTVACAVLAALKKRGADPCAFKSGPDYIDPMFHRSALQVDSHNLDLFLSNRDMVRAIFARYAAGHGAART